MKSELTIAQQMLSLVFEGHNIRTVIVDGTPRFFRNDVAAACSIVHVRKSINLHLDSDELGVTKVTVRSANGTSQIREFATLTESGVLALVFASRKPAARRFRRWVTEIVMPDIIRYGTFLGEATKGERVNALYGRYKQSRTSFISEDAEAYATSGLLTIAAFRKVSPVPVRNVLEFCAVLRSKASLAGYEPQRFYTGPKRHTPAWPLDLLQDAARSTTHFLPFSLEN